MELSLSTRETPGCSSSTSAARSTSTRRPSCASGWSRLVDAGAHRLVVDLEDVEFLDSTGLGVLVGALKRIRAHGGSLTSSAARTGCSRSSGSPGSRRSSRSTPTRRRGDRRQPRPRRAPVEPRPGRSRGAPAGHAAALARLRAVTSCVMSDPRTPHKSRGRPAPLVEVTACPGTSLPTARRLYRSQRGNLILVVIVAVVALVALGHGVRSSAARCWPPPRAPRRCRRSGRRSRRAPRRT